MHASKAANSDHSLIVWIKIASSWIRRFRPSEMHIFWDCDKKDVWRKSIYPDYKENDIRNNKPDEDINNISLLIKIISELAPHINLKQHFKANQECDDLIYSACKLLTPANNENRHLYIISKDSDFNQIPFYMKHVDCYDPYTSMIIDKNGVNPVILKSLIGDDADNIPGYRGIGPVKGTELANNYRKLQEFFKSHGDTIFRRNLALVDMSLNPYSLKNELYIADSLCQDVKYDTAAFAKVLSEYKIMGTLGRPQLLMEFNQVRSNI